MSSQQENLNIQINNLNSQITNLVNQVNSLQISNNNLNNQLVITKAELAKEQGWWEKWFNDDKEGVMLVEDYDPYHTKMVYLNSPKKQLNQGKFKILSLDKHYKLWEGIVWSGNLPFKKIIQEQFYQYYRDK